MNNRPRIDPLDIDMSFVNEVIDSDSNDQFNSPESPIEEGNLGVEFRENAIETRYGGYQNPQFNQEDRTSNFIHQGIQNDDYNSPRYAGNWINEQSQFSSYQQDSSILQLQSTWLPTRYMNNQGNFPPIEGRSGNLFNGALWDPSHQEGSYHQSYHPENPNFFYSSPQVSNHPSLYHQQVTSGTLSSWQEPTIDCQRFQSPLNLAPSDSVVNPSYPQEVRQHTGKMNQRDGSKDLPHQQDTRHNPYQRSQQVIPNVAQHGQLPLLAYPTAVYGSGNQQSLESESPTNPDQILQTRVSQNDNLSRVKKICLKLKKEKSNRGAKLILNPEKSTLIRREREARKRKMNIKKSILVEAILKLNVKGYLRVTFEQQFSDHIEVIDSIKHKHKKRDGRTRSSDSKEAVYFRKRYKKMKNDEKFIDTFIECVMGYWQDILGKKWGIEDF